MERREGYRVNLKTGDKVRIKIFPHDTAYTITGELVRTWNTYYLLNDTTIPFLAEELEVVNDNA